MSLSFRADHVGSFLRPAELLDARRSHSLASGDFTRSKIGISSGFFNDRKSSGSKSSPTANFGAPTS